ncbi:MAG: hypothetical protein A2V83_00015 [Nitrospirae bacterium RBG_16_64_22]|nr:MAG: hypothetical protein A2V83_00015 [Nitrospirae bacterium RBG_16_64_22]
MSSSFVRHLLFPLHEGLKGKPTFSALRFLEKSQWWRPEDLRRLQVERLKALVESAKRETTFYGERLQDVKAGQIRSVDAISEVPFLRRADLQERGEEIRSRRREGVTRMSTGGSSGQPVSFYVDQIRMGWNEGARLRSHRWFGIEPGEREVVIWGSPIELTRQDRMRTIRDRILGSLLLSAFEMSDRTMERYDKMIRAHRPRKIYSYASSIALQAEYVLSTGRPPYSGIRAVFATAEPLLPFQREAITRAFDCPVAVEYGARDAGLIAHDCPQGRLHVNVENVIVEIVPLDGSVPPGAGQAGESGEIVVTDLNSAAFPFIRYRTGDVGRWAEGPCPCGRSLPALAAVEGRTTDFLVARDGRRLHALSVIYILREMESVGRFRVTQEEVDRFVVEIVPRGEWGEGDEMRIRSRFDSLFGEPVRVEIVLRDDLPAGPSGKHRYVVSNVRSQERLEIGNWKLEISK